MQVDRIGMEILERPECLALLRTRPTARLGLTMQALPIVLPVTFMVADDELLIRTGTDTKLTAAAARSVVAVEVDDFDAGTHAGWSVLVRGRCRPLEDPDEVAQARARWGEDEAGEPDDQWIAVPLQVVSGRRINH